MKLATVILNYNDASETIAQIERVRAISLVDHIVVVDNASTDGSYAQLSEYIRLQANKTETSFDINKSSVTEIRITDISHNTKKTIILIESKKNGGYGYGNNIGVRYAIDHLACDHVIIANPDAVFDEAVVRNMAKAFRNDENIGIIGVTLENNNRYEGYIRSGRKKRVFLEELLYSAPLLKRIFRDRINYPYDYYYDITSKETSTNPGVPVYAVHGSLLMVSADAFAKSGGYDENIFLYMEEYILGARMEKAGYTTKLLTDTFYKHAGSHSISGSGMGAVRRQKERQKSEFYYYKNYLGANKTQLFFAGLLQKIVLFETWMLALVKIE